MNSLDKFSHLCRGYFPKGGGEVEIVCEPIREIHSSNLTDLGEVCNITGRSFVAGVLPIKVMYMHGKSVFGSLNRLLGLCL